MNSSQDPDYVLTLSCPDRPGLTAAVASALASVGCNLNEAQQFNDPESRQYFQRLRFAVGPSGIGAAKDALAPVIGEFTMKSALRDLAVPRKVVMMVSKFDHCLGDLLYRNRIGELNMDVTAVIGNHPKEALNISLLGDTPYHHLPITKDTKPKQEDQIKELISETGAELVVLARYMQILSDDMVTFLSGGCINIHHSFLPGFKGAKPYHQAFARGVKVIGATTHYVNTDLDEGLIIHQDVEAITHKDQPYDLIRKGRDVERRVLAEGVRLHLEDRTFIVGKKTVVLR